MSTNSSPLFGTTSPFFSWDAGSSSWTPGPASGKTTNSLVPTSPANPTSATADALGGGGSQAQTTSYNLDGSFNRNAGRPGPVNGAGGVYTPTSGTLGGTGTPGQTFQGPGATPTPTPTDAFQAGFQSPVFGGTQAALSGGTAATQSTLPTTPTTPTTQPVISGTVGQSTSPTNIPVQSNFSGNPFAANPGFTGPNGPGGYGPQTFATQDYANSIAQQYGGTVTSNPAAGLLGAPNSPFQTNQPQYMVTLANGTVIDPARIGSIYANAGPGGLTAYDQAQIQDILGGSTGAALNQPGFNGVNQAFPAGTPINSGGGVQPNTGGYTPTPAAVQSFANQSANPATMTALSTDLINNPFNMGPGSQYPVNSPYGGNTNGQVPTAATTAATTATAANPGGIDWSNLNAQTLPYALQFLQAYSGLGSGAGNPTSINSNGQIGQVIAQLLSGITGDQSLYTRQRQYPAAP